ncbi:hypothetical protein EST38_g11483, partial [Candolleomyces aberdarensis]
NQFEGDPRSPAYILHWKADHNDLRMWAWYVDVLADDFKPGGSTSLLRPCGEDGSRIPPDELSAHKLTHLFLGPCCFCAFLKGTQSYTEATILLLESVNTNRNDPERRPFIGEWVAQCTRENSCGYFVVLERFYACRVLLTKKYTKRDKPLKADMWDFLKDETDEDKFLCGTDTGLRRIFTPHTDATFSKGVNQLKRVREEFPEEIEETENRIDSLHEGGLPASEFWNLFVQCARCGFIMGKHRYPYAHRCPKRLRNLEEEANTGGAVDNQNDDEEDEENGSSVGVPEDYDYYLQFAPPEIPSPDVSSDSELEIDTDDLSGLDEDDDDNLPDPATVLAMIGACSRSSQ